MILRFQLVVDVNYVDQFLKYLDNLYLRTSRTCLEYIGTPRKLKCKLWDRKRYKVFQAFDKL